MTQAEDKKGVGKFEVSAVSVLTVINQFLKIWIGILLANYIGPVGFGDYMVVVSIMYMVTSFSKLGLDRYALKAVTLMKQDGDHSGLRGFFFFCFWAVTILSLIVGGVLVTGHQVIGQFIDKAGHHHPILFMSFALIPYALLKIFSDITTAMGAPIRSALIYRLLFPVLIIVGIFIFDHLGDQKLHGEQFGKGALDQHMSMLIFTLSVMITSLAMIILLRFSTPKEVWTSERRIAPKPWLIGGIPFMYHQLMGTVMSYGSVMVIEFFHGGHLVGKSEESEHLVGQIGAIISIMMFANIVASAINRLYIPRFMSSLNAGDGEQCMKMWWRHTMTALLVCVIFLPIILIFGRQILGLYHKSFEAGYWALVIGVVAILTRLFASMPVALLSHTGMAKKVMIVNTVVTFSVLGLMGPLSREWDAFGAMLSMLIILSLAHPFIYYMGHRHMKHMIRDGADLKV